MIGLTSTMSRSVVIAVASQPPLAVLRPLNSHQQYHRCQEQHRSTDYRSAYHKQSTSPPTCPRLQVVFFQSTRCACWQFRLCAARAPRRRARVALCALGVLLERAALDEGDFPAPPFVQLHQPAPSAPGITWLVQSTLREKIASASRAPNACQYPCYV